MNAVRSVQQPCKFHMVFFNFLIIEVIENGCREVFADISENVPVL